MILIINRALIFQICAQHKPGFLSRFGQCSESVDGRWHVGVEGTVVLRWNGLCHFIRTGRSIKYRSFEVLTWSFFISNAGRKIEPHRAANQFHLLIFRFYTHLYKNLLSLHAGKNHEDVLIVLRTLTNILVKRRKKISQNRLTAFLKRISILALQLEHNGTLGSLAIVKTVMQLGKAADILLDTDASIGDGFYDPELNEPEYCNAQRSALWELVPLQVY